MAVFAKRYFRFPENKKHGRVSPEKHLLWPVYIYQITYPDFANKHLNLFQEGILGLLRAGCKHPEEIASLLSLDVDLVKFIIETQLESNGWVANEKITNKGRLVLDGKEWRKGSSEGRDSESDTVKLKMGYAFWDTIGQQWMPRMSAHLSELEPCSFQDNFPVFERERQKGGTFRPYCLTPQDSAAPKVIAGDMLSAYRTYRLDIDHAKQLGMRPEREQQIALQSIDVVSNEPERAYLWVSLTRNENDLEPWAVIDPFHIRTKVSWLRKPILTHINNEPGLAKQLAHLTGTAQAEKQTAEQWLQAIDAEVKMKLLAEYPYLANHGTITHYLNAVLHHQVKIEEGIDNSGQKDALLTELQKLIESVLKWMLDTWRIDSMRLNQSLSRQPNNREIKQVYSYILPDLPDQTINQLSKQSWGKIRSVLQHRGTSYQSAKALLCGVILSTSEHPGHPFKALSAFELNLPKLLELLDTRNAAGHASGREFSKQEVLDLSQFTLQWMKNFKEHF